MIALVGGPRSISVIRPVWMPEGLSLLYRNTKSSRGVIVGLLPRDEEPISLAARKPAFRRPIVVVEHEDMSVYATVIDRNMRLAKWRRVDLVPR